MAMKNCARCGRVFDSETESDVLCRDCELEEKKDLKKVVDYLRKAPLASIIDVSRDTGVSRAQLLRFVKRGNFKMRGQASEFKCRICGKAIKSGAVCSSCRSKIEGGFNSRKK